MASAPTSCARLALRFRFHSLSGSANPLGYHLASLIYHVLNVLQVAAIARFGQAPLADWRNVRRSAVRGPDRITRDGLLD